MCDDWKEKANKVRGSVAKACAKAGVDPAVWIEEEISKANRAKPRNEAEIETLKLVRDGLRLAASRKKRVRSHSQ